MSDENQAFEPLRKSITESIQGHRTGPDAWLYNGGTVLVLVLTAVVSVLTGSRIVLQGLEWLPSVLSAFAGVLVALERSLGFGPRWRHHTELKSGYKTVLDMISYYFVIPAAEVDQKKKVRAEIWQSLNALRSRESSIPNSGGTVTQ
jgi:hypothetical protein